MQKILSTIKKIIFAVLMLYMLSGLTFFFLYTCSEISFVSSFIRAVGWYSYFFNDGIILPFFIFIPEAFVIAAIVWIFFRKETSVLLRSIITAVPFWQLISFYASAYAFDPYSSKISKFLIFLTIAVFIVIYFFLFRELRVKSKNIHHEG